MRAIREHRIPSADSRPYILCFDREERHVWFCESGANRIGRLEIASGRIDEFVIPTPDSRPIDIRAAEDGNFYFTENAGNKIGRISPDGTIHEFPLPTPGSGPDGLKVGPDGNLWFCLPAVGRVARMDLAGHVREFGGFPADAKPLSPIFVGEEIWFSDPAGHRIFKMTYDGQLAETAAPQGSPRAMTLGPDGNLWFTLTGGNAIGCMATDGTRVRRFPLPETSARALVWVGEELWFTNETRDCIGHMNAEGRLLGEYLPPTPKAGLRALRATSNGALFFSEHYAGQIGELPA